MAPNEIVSPYSIKNLDDTIAHLKRVIGTECAQTIFGKRYWYGRIQQMQATPVIIHAQLGRLRTLLDRLDAAAPCTNRPSRTSRAR